MNPVNELLISLEDGTFEAIFEGMLYTMKKPDLNRLASDMAANTASIEDDRRKVLFEKGLSYLHRFLAQQ
ncbi:MAG: hypothetical protein OEZ59_04275 [Deltaproteobacteria bacterium]|nr:hypothetical protein [Deltaproteobacteria bacterium]